MSAALFHMPGKDGHWLDTRFSPPTNHSALIDKCLIFVGFLVGAVGLEPTTR